jgi:transposase ISL3 family protein
VEADVSARLSLGSLEQAVDGLQEPIGLPRGDPREDAIEVLADQLFEVFVLLLCREMPFSGVTRITGVSVHRVMALAERYVNAAVGAADFSDVRRLAIDETSRAKGHDYVTVFADEL